MKKSLIKTKTPLFALFLSLSGCSSLPPFPEVWQCAYSVKFNKFRCCNSNTKECANLKRDDTRMEAAQCLSADDYKASQEWLNSVIDLAQKHCR